MSDGLPEDSGYFELFAGRRERNPPFLAKKLHQWRYIYTIYGALDGLSLSYSTIKYLFDILSDGQSTSDEMHDWLMEPGGALAAASGSLTLIVFSMLANHYSDDDPNLFKRYLVALWPYFRDTFKGAKNAFKGIKSAFHVVEGISGHNLRFLFVPVGLLLGGISVINRIWYRRMLTERKSMMKDNAKLLEEIQACTTLEDFEDFLTRIRKQTEKQKRLALLSATYGGIVDGLYLYIGILGLCSLAPPVLIAMGVFSAIYVITSIATRVYEEYDFQRKLDIAEAKIELAHSGKKIELMFDKLHWIQKKISCGESELCIEQERLAKDFIEAITVFEEKRKKYRAVTTLSYTSAVLAGAKSGLYAYSALASIIFAIGTILVLASVPFPPALLIICVSMGLVFLIGFIAHSVINTYRHHRKVEEELAREKEQNAVANPDKKTLSNIVHIYETSKDDVAKLEPEKVKIAILDGMTLDPTPQFFFEEWFEVVRSFASGVGKGAKAISLTMNPLEIADAQGHYHESVAMMGFIAISAIIHTITLGLRAYARMGRATLDKPFQPVGVIQVSEKKSTSPKTPTGEECTQQTSSCQLKEEKNLPMEQRDLEKLTAVGGYKNPQIEAECTTPIIVESLPQKESSVLLPLKTRSKEFNEEISGKTIKEGSQKNSILSRLYTSIKSPCLFTQKSSSPSSQTFSSKALSLQQSRPTFSDFSLEKMTEMSFI